MVTVSVESIINFLISIAVGKWEKERDKDIRKRLGNKHSYKGVVDYMSKRNENR